MAFTTGGTGGTLEEIVNTEFISTMVGDYAADAVVITPFFRVEDLRGKSTAVASFASWVKDAATQHNDAATDTAVALETAQASATAGEYSILRDLTFFAKDTNMLGVGIQNEIARDGAYLCMEYLETLAAALFASITANETDSGAAATVSDLLGMVDDIAQAKFQGNRVFHGHQKQCTDFMSNLLTLAGAVYGKESTSTNVNGQVGQNGYFGNILGIDLFGTSVVPTANMAADYVGCLHVDSARNPRQAAFGLALLREPTVTMTTATPTLSDQISIHAAAGVGIINNAAASKLVTGV